MTGMQVNFCDLGISAHILLNKILNLFLSMSCYDRLIIDAHCMTWFCLVQANV